MLKRVLYFTFITAFYLYPVIPMTIKGIIGIVFIIISSTKISLMGSLFTAFLMILLQAANYVYDNNIDFKVGIINVIVGSLVYFFVALYLGISADKMKNKNKELQFEILARKCAEKELKENLSLLESLMSTLPTPVSFKDLQFRYTGCNPAYEEYFGLSEQEIKGKNAHELFEPEIADICLQMDIDLLENKTRKSREVSFMSREGKPKYFIFTKALMSDDKGNATGTVSVFLDTTDHKERERLLVSIEEEKLIIDEMKKYDRLKTEFFSNISHELRTPLNVIFCAVQLMEMHLDDKRSSITPGFVKKNVSTIRQNSLRLLRLVNNLIDITKIDAQSLEIKLRNQDIVSIMKEITLSAADYVSNKGLKLAFHSNVTEKIMAFDEEKIERILLNLMANAVKFSPPGAAIYVDLTDNGTAVCIKVRDMGIGIPPDRRRDIFERFSQISPIHTRLQEGSGIGLNLVKSLVEMHQGTITVESEYGKGATFIVELPCTVLPEGIKVKEDPKDRRSRLENIQLEFSDIDLTNEEELNDVECKRDKKLIYI